MRKFGIVKAARLLALKAVLDPDEEYYVRRVFRWYSRNFHTPLHMVPDLPLEEVLEAYYENVYEEVVAEDEPGKLEEAIRELVETDEERQKREMAEAGNDIVTEDFLRKIMAEEELKRLKKKAGAIEGVDRSQKPALTKDTAKKEAVMPDFEDLPDIKVVYDDSDEVKEMGNWDIADDLFGDPKK